MVEVITLKIFRFSALIPKQAGYAAPVLLGHPMNREPARPWEPSLGNEKITTTILGVFPGVENDGKNSVRVF